MSNSSKSNPLRDLPAVNDILLDPGIESVRSRFSHGQIADAIRAELAALRTVISKEPSTNGECTPASVVASVVERLARDHRPRLRPVINATGIVLHTNLGRAPIAEAAAQAAYDAAHGYLNLELDLDTGKRSSRQNPIREWVARLTGAESATVVNNNAAATVIALRTLAQGREVIVSRSAAAFAFPTSWLSPARRFTKSALPTSRA
jgi:L-seryl-tRNA(Ser) seleniumtransferase